MTFDRFILPGKSLLLSALQRLALPAACAAIAVSLAGTPCGAAEEERAELRACFERQGATGTFALLDPATGKCVVFNSERAHRRFVPASTFKIPNTVIGLDAGAVRSVDEVLPYGGKPQPFKEWEKDMSLRDAIRISCVPIYQELARRIGLETMRAKVAAFQYGNAEIGSVIDRFWLDGPLAISAVEQTEFLARLVAGKLPASPQALDAVKEITVQERTDGFTLHAKTGWAMSVTPQIGWWVGWIEREGKAYPFALNIDMTGDADAPKRATIGKECIQLALRAL